MSLNVTNEEIDQAVAGQLSRDDFVDIIARSLPWPYAMLERLVVQVRSGESHPFACNTTPPPSEEARGQLLRMVGSDAMRRALRRHFRLRVAFQNCHCLAVFQKGPKGYLAYRRFISVRNQVLNQRPELRDC